MSASCVIEEVSTSNKHCNSGAKCLVVYPRLQNGHSEDRCRHSILRTTAFGVLQCTFVRSGGSAEQMSVLVYFWRKHQTNVGIYGSLGALADIVSGSALRNGFKILRKKSLLSNGRITGIIASNVLRERSRNGRDKGLGMYRKMVGKSVEKGLGTFRATVPATMTNGTLAWQGHARQGALGTFRATVPTTVTNVTVACQGRAISYDSACDSNKCHCCMSGSRQAHSA
ncbi:hypothetical protein L6452_32372 [Arctium lappa]|uniref:Uncharacterized protein n=1 Tax=Arctium lappa TaxID=4217 RepID=A0ACB8Z4B8_ARCLA|nr:hypothetical protein L6452_32372 [Arctium lappa]